MADEGGIRVEFEDFVVDPRNPDHAYRALEVAADLVTFEDAHAVFWCEGVEEVRFPVSAIRSLAPRVPAVGKVTAAEMTAAAGNGAGGRMRRQRRSPTSRKCAGSIRRRTPLGPRTTRRA
ncbi:hypothetical protein ACU686_29555 [Yinghuangia aomiensis]